MHKSLAAVPIISLLSLVGCSGDKAQSAPARQPVALVTTVDVVERSVPLEIHVVGNVEAYTAIRVKAQVGGQLVKVYFREGQDVKAGRPPVPDRPAALRRGHPPGGGQPGQGHRPASTGGGQPSARHGFGEVRPRPGHPLPEALRRGRDVQAAGGAVRLRRRRARPRACAPARLPSRALRPPSGRTRPPWRTPSFSAATARSGRPSTGGRGTSPSKRATWCEPATPKLITINQIQPDLRHLLGPGEPAARGEEVHGRAAS